MSSDFFLTSAPLIMAHLLTDLGESSWRRIRHPRWKMRLGYGLSAINWWVAGRSGNCTPESIPNNR